jgi:hypothetical protein
MVLTMVLLVVRTVALPVEIGTSSPTAHCHLGAKPLSFEIHINDAARSARLRDSATSNLAIDVPKLAKTDRKILQVRIALAALA